MLLCKMVQKSLDNISKRTQAAKWPLLEKFNYADRCHARCVSVSKWISEQIFAVTSRRVRLGMFAVKSRRVRLVMFLRIVGSRSAPGGPDKE